MNEYFIIFNNFQWRFLIIKYFLIALRLDWGLGKENTPKYLEQVLNKLITVLASLKSLD